MRVNFHEFLFSVFDIDGRTIMTILRERANSLKSLKLPKNWLEDKFMKNWDIQYSIRLLKHLHLLNELQISNCITKICYELFNFNMLATVLSKLPNLKKLIIIVDEFNTFFGDEKFENLENLELKVESETRMVNVFPFVVVRNCPNLTKLEISGAETIQNKDLDVIKKLSKLQCLRIKNCKQITKEYIEETFGDIGVFERTEN